ncbi:MAG: thiol protease/hemagglutinin PrtT [Muribaculaceae bacterium]|nr:thiol protease/hemagglutinin PrtT [Muribaculaceae bacterium]
MRKLFTLSLLLAATAASARQISPDEAKNAADAFLNSKSLVPVEAASPLTRSGEQPYYVFNAADNNGFVIISGDDRYSKVLGYSDRGSFDPNHMPPQLKAMLDNFAENSAKPSSSSNVHPSWTITTTLSTRAEEGILLETANWGQGAPFNLRAPEFDGSKAPIGCVPLAMAIICKYQNYPSKAVIAKEHKWYSNGTPHYYNYGKMDIDYSLLKDSYSDDEVLTEDEKNAISELLFACAATAQTQFAFNGSSAWVQDMAHVLREVLGFSEECHYISRMYFEDDHWNLILKDQLEKKMPVIYDGLGDWEGHAFVIDGYDSANLYHVNWGWSGSQNGYYSLNDLNGFNLRQGMLINLTAAADPSLYSQKYSRMWVDGGVREAPVNGAGKSRGLRINVTDVEKDKEFRAKVGVVYSPAEFDGQTAIGLLDENDNVIEVSDTHSVYNYIREDDSWYQLGKEYGYFGGQSWESIIFKSEIKDTYKIAYVSKEKGENNWKLIPGTLDAPTIIPTKGNSANKVKFAFNFVGDKNKVNISLQEKDYMIGDYCHLQIGIEDGVVALYKDGQLRCHGTTFRPINEDIDLSDYNCNLTAVYKSRNELLEKSYNVAEAGTLSQLISDSDKENIGSIIISGNINSIDMACIAELPFLMNIDLEDAHFVAHNGDLEGFMPKFSLYVYDIPFAPPFETIKFPKDLKGFHQISGCSWNVAVLDIPATVEKYEYACLTNSPVWSSMSFINVRNPNPVDLEPNVFKHSSKLTLFVPKGSKAAYMAHPDWQKFEDIREVSDEFPFIGEFVEEENSTYLILTDFAAIVGFKGMYETDQIKDYVEYKGKVYPVKSSVALKLNAPANLIVNTIPDFDWNNNSANTLFLADVNSSYKNLVWFENAFVPGGTTDNVARADEMFSYSINKDQGLIRIIPVIDGLTIDEVIINGNKFQVTDEGIYAYKTKADSDMLDVTVNYTLFDKFKMTSSYNGEFNATMPESNFESGVGMIGLSDIKTPVLIYDLHGKLVYSGYLDKMNLPTGMYILHDGQTAHKLVIRN